MPPPRDTRAHLESLKPPPPPPRGQLQKIKSDPARVKVLHGADRDILWLQRDLGLYVVNMFDTGQAARVLEYPMKSLAYLLKTHCGVTASTRSSVTPVERFCPSTTLFTSRNVKAG